VSEHETREPGPITLAAASHEELAREVADRMLELEQAYGMCTELRNAEADLYTQRIKELAAENAMLRAKVEDLAHQVTDLLNLEHVPTSSDIDSSWEG